VCGDLLKEAEVALKEAEVALKKAKEREAAETRLQIMESERDKLILLADAVQDEAEERSLAGSSTRVVRLCTIRGMC
jgi:predicted HAD superfamily phosphohydrolase